MDSYWKNKKVLITGGAGFIGSNLSKNLVECGSEVSIVDNLERGDKIFPDVKKFIMGDLRNSEFCYDIIKDFDIVIHLASKVGGIGYYLDKPSSVMSDNILIDSNVLSAVLKNKINKYFYASSAHVYPTELQQSIDILPIKENQIKPYNPELSYGWAKLTGEKQLEYTSKEFPDTKIAIARYIGIYGCNQDYNLDTGSVIPVFINRAINYPVTPFNVWGTGKETRSYCFIDDAIECTKLMIEKLDDVNFLEPMNVGRQERVSIEEIANKVVDISGKNIEIEFDTSKETHIWGHWFDCSKAEEVLGWRANTTFEDGLKKVYEDINRRLNDEVLGK